MPDIFPTAGEADYAGQQTPVIGIESDKEVVPLAERSARAWGAAENNTDRPITGHPYPYENPSRIDV
ncbi:hypothetical protein AB0H76_13840 [Nocardia sp. NPDC050712]|uniref:hypothetical protein n=1 Tax=Nocardia sp. NPDC050712 TaxID=3155518 RepID=UPI0033E3626C